MELYRADHAADGRKIIEKEKRPDALLPTMGGQTALNWRWMLADHGVLEKYGVEMIGATAEAIDKAEDREKFNRPAMTKIGLKSARSAVSPNLEKRCRCKGEIGFPAIIRPIVHARRHRRRHRLQPRRVYRIVKRGLEAARPTKC